MKHFLKRLLIGVFAAVTLLCSSCNVSSDEDFFASTTVRNGTQKTQSTTGKTVEKEIPSKLEPEFYEVAQPLSRMTDAPYVVDIGGSGVTVSLSYQGWPTICRGDGETLYAASSLRIGHVDPFSVTAFFKSEDGGKTWSEARIINDTPLDDRDTGIVYIGGGKLAITFFTVSQKSFLENGEYNTDWGWGYSTAEQRAAKRAEWTRLGDKELAKYQGSFILLSDDYGETWSEPIKIPACCPHGPSLMKSGNSLIMSGLSQSSGETYFCTYVSRDYGRTWSKNSEVKMPSLPKDDNTWGYFEPHVIQCSDGSYIGGIRVCTTKGPANTVETYGIFITRSHNGKDWTEPEKIEGLVGSPPHFLELSNGVILLTYSYRLEERGCRGRLSYDGGVTWTDDEIIISRNTSTKNNDLGYPSTVEMDDGTLITGFYQSYGDDPNASVLYTRWRLNEVEGE